MRLYYGLVLAVVAALLTAGASTAQAAKGVKKGVEQKVHGTVLGIHHGRHGTYLTIKVHHHQGKAAAAHGRGHRAFHVSRATRINGQLHRGAHVVVWARGHHADRVELVQHMGKRKRAA
jgi:hypothetical protein